MGRKKAAYADEAELAARIAAARGLRPADLVVRNARWLDVFSGRFETGDVAVHGDTIVGVGDAYDGARAVFDAQGAFLVPGFIDAHVHLESSLMTPARFQQAVLPCGTTAVIWDPHEIANVRGTEGIAWALEASADLDLDVFVMVPSCVPSTTPSFGLETSGAELVAAHLAPFRSHPRVLGLAEMMNFPGLLSGDPDVLKKLIDFNDMKRDGHCPGLTGKDLNAYGAAGIHSCHESTSLPEAREKLKKGIHVLIREGSCAKDADALLPLLDAYTSSVLSFCSDDRNPADIAAEGHISCIIDKALRAGHRPEDAFRAASFGPARTYGLEDRGAIAPGYRADFVVVTPNAGDFRHGMTVAETFKNGARVDPAKLKAVGDARTTARSLSKNLRLGPEPVTAASLEVPGHSRARVIGVIPRQILTRPLTATLPAGGGFLAADLSQDILKIAVFERHHGSGRHATAFVQGFGLKHGAIATSINHDSHNIIAVGSSDAAILRAIDRLRAIDGGIVVVADGGSAAGQEESLALPVGGLMTDADPVEVTAALHRLKALATAIGCTLEEPFLQLSFLALPVIPALKITDRGLVDVAEFKLVPVAF